MQAVAFDDGQGSRRAAGVEHEQRRGTSQHTEGVAAIASSVAAQLYGLHVLFENIEDNPDNVTRFFVIGREAVRRSGDDKTAIMFTTAHTPGRWHRCSMCSRRMGST